MAPAPRRRATLAAALLGVLLTGCADLKALDSAPVARTERERALVHEKVETLLSEGRRADWGEAWNQTVSAGADRARLEEVALGALAASDGDAKDMFDALRAKWGPLAPAARERVAALVDEAAARGDWERAVEIEIETADDAPEYARAWAVYQRAPAKEGQALLDAIEDARKEHAEGGG